MLNCIGAVKLKKRVTYTQKESNVRVSFDSSACNNRPVNVCSLTLRKYIVIITNNYVCISITRVISYAMFLWAAYFIVAVSYGCTPACSEHVCWRSCAATLSVHYSTLAAHLCTCPMQLWMWRPLLRTIHTIVHMICVASLLSLRTIGQGALFDSFYSLTARPLLRWARMGGVLEQCRAGCLPIVRRFPKCSVSARHGTARRKLQYLYSSERRLLLR